MTYESARRSEILSGYDSWSNEYANTYLAGRPTVIFLPGGMGSQLDQSKSKYVNDSSIPFGSYDPVWMDLGMLFDSEARTLRIESDGRDVGGRIIRHNGPLRFPTKPYDATERYFRANGCNYVPFSYDWRQPLTESADYLKEFLRRLQKRVIALRGEDPLPAATILCHSMGGLVAKTFLHRMLPAGSPASEYKKWFARIVTVGTPFYGTGTHMRRFYVGVPELDILYRRKELAEIVASMPGPYILNLLDLATFHRDGAALGLARYPVRDADNPALEADPFDPINDSRWPTWLDRAHLRTARRTFELISRPLPAHLANRLYHIRSGLRQMPVEHRWKNINGSAFNPANDPAPFTDILGPGDGTVPFFSARLAQTPAANIFNLQQADDHGELVEHGETLDVVWHLIDHDTLPSAIPNPSIVSAVPKASREATRQYLAHIKAGSIQRNHPPDVRIWRRLIEETTLC